MKVLIPLALLLSAHLVLGGRDHSTNEEALSLLRERTPSEHKTQSAAATANLSLRGGRALEHECPGGIDGYYCGNNPHVPDYLLDNRLYKCKGGDYSEDDWEDSCWNNHPVQFCKVNGNGHDACVDACPDGIDGFYCGNNPDVPSHLVDGRLYYCEDGDYSEEDDWVDTCTNNPTDLPSPNEYQICQVNGGGKDQCVDPEPTCPGGMMTRVT